MSDQLTLIDGRDALAVLIVHANPDDPTKRPRSTATAWTSASSRRCSTRSAMSLRDQVLADAEPTEAVES